MEKFVLLAEILSNKFSPECMCQILGKANKEKIHELLKEYGIES